MGIEIKNMEYSIKKCGKIGNTDYMIRYEGQDKDYNKITDLDFAFNEVFNTPKEIDVLSKEVIDVFKNEKNGTLQLLYTSPQSRESIFFQNGELSTYSYEMHTSEMSYTGIYHKSELAFAFKNPSYFLSDKNKGVIENIQKTITTKVMRYLENNKEDINPKIIVK